MPVAPLPGQGRISKIGGNGRVSFTANLSRKVKIGNLVTATATDAQNNSSEFSAAVAVKSGGADPLGVRLMVLDAVVSGGFGFDSGFPLTAVRRGRWSARG